jgi:hypothetical protein
MTDEIKPVLEAILSELRAMRETASQPAKEFLSVEELSGQLGIAPKTVRNQLSAGTFPLKPKKIGGRVLFRAADLKTL